MRPEELDVSQSVNSTVLTFGGFSGKNLFISIELIFIYYIIYIIIIYL